MGAAMLEVLARMGITLTSHDRIYGPDKARMQHGPCKVQRVGPSQGWHVVPFMAVPSGAWPGDSAEPVPFRAWDRNASPAIWPELATSALV